MDTSYGGVYEVTLTINIINFNMFIVILFKP